MLGNLLIGSCNVDFANREVDFTTVAYTLSQTVQLDGDANGDGFLVVHLVEVDMKQRVGNGMELQLFDDGLVCLAIDVEVDNVNIGCVDYLAQFGCGAGKCQSNGLAFFASFAIEVTGNETFFSQKF